MNDNDIQNLNSISDFDELENQLEATLADQLEGLDVLEREKDKIKDPDSLGDTVQSVIWDQFINQVGAIAGEDFIRENRGLTLDLRDSAHIQTADNFEKGKIATHNYKSREQLEHNYDRYKNKPHSQFRKEYVNRGMDSTLPRAGTLNSSGQETVKDIYTGRQIPTQTKLEDGRNNPCAAQREHVKSSSELYQDASLQMANSDQELADIINDPENLQGYTTAERNNRKSDRSKDDMDPYDKTKHWEQANERAEEFIDKKKKEGEDRLKQEGKKTQREEAFRIGGKALRAVLMGLLADLMKTIIQKLVKWLRSGEKKWSVFMGQIKEAIHTFVSNLKSKLITAADTLFTTIASAIFGPIISVFKKVGMFLKQGYKSLKEAISYIRKPENKGKPISILMLEIGKILVAGLTAGGALILGEVIEKGLMSIPIFAIQIPLLGSLASLLGVFFGALVSGLIGALILNLIDRAIAKKKEKINRIQTINSQTKVIGTQRQLIEATNAQMEAHKVSSAMSIENRHKEANKLIHESFERMVDDKSASANVRTANDESLDNLFDQIDKL